MILELLSGVFVSFIVIIFFQSLKFIKSVNNWIIVISKFVYYSGHPLLDDDQIYEQITKRFKNVFTSLVIVILKIVFLFIIIFVAIALSSLVVSVVRGEDLPGFRSEDFLSFYFPKYLLNYPFIIGTLLPLAIIPFLKKKKTESGPYSPMEKFLHYTFLGNKNIAIFLFKFELWRNRKNLKTISANQNVYISGMARAGTTVLMQYLGQIEQFKSLSYRNMPFLFLPKTWLSFTKNNKSKEKERFHQDGIKHSLNSYEALEEPFWRAYIGEEYIRDNTIENHTIDEKLFDKYNSFRRLVAGDNIYLAKNNNHLLRAESLHEWDKKIGNNSITIIPFRDPYDQARSLMQQHKLLTSLQEEDEFTLDYMDFLVHHEFGLHQKVCLLSDKIEFTQGSKNKDTIGYWLEIWYLFYQEANLKFSKLDNFHFFCYENFVEHPKRSLEDLFIILNLQKDLIDTISINKFSPANTEQIDGKNNKYSLLYKKMKSISLNKNNG